MGIATSKCSAKKQQHRIKELNVKIHSLEEEMKEVKRARKRDAETCEEHVSAFASKEEEWRKERKKHKDEAVRLRSRLKDEEVKAKRLQEEVVGCHGADKDWRELSASFLVEQMKQEQARREETVHKWKQLYLAIKTELDDLIQRTHQGERCCWGDEQCIIEGLQRELKAKEEIAESLRLKIAVMEKEAVRKEREIDILRQSLRILSSDQSRRVKKTMPKGMCT